MCHTGMWHTVGGRGWILERALCPTVWDWGIGEGIRLVEWSICMRWEGVATKNTRGGWVKVCIVVYDTHFYPSRLDSGRRRRESSLCIHRGATRGGWIRILLLLYFSIFLSSRVLLLLLVVYFEVCGGWWRKSGSWILQEDQRQPSGLFGTLLAARVRVLSMLKLIISPDLDISVSTYSKRGAEWVSWRGGWRYLVHISLLFFVLFTPPIRNLESA